MIIIKKVISVKGKHTVDGLDIDAALVLNHLKLGLLTSIIL